MRVEITLEKTMRVAKEFDASEEQLKMLEYGVNPFHDEMEKELESGDIAYDYAVADMCGRTIVDWK